MANSFFQFKQFRIEQGKTAMKVCTDSCIFGAYINVASSKKVLDIGTGTGLLALMIAQKSEAFIDAVEIEENAFQQASANIKESKWAKRIKILHTSIQHYTTLSSEKFDTIVSNPPFFSNQLKSPKKNKNVAHHSDALSLDELAQCVQQLLTADGSFYLLLPEFEFLQFISLAKNYHLFPESILSVKDKINSPVFRMVGKFTFMEKAVSNDTMYIKNADGEYSERFIELLKDYYLYL